MGQMQVRSAVISGSPECAAEQLMTAIFTLPLSTNSKMELTSPSHDNTSKPRCRNEPASNWLSMGFESARRTVVTVGTAEVSVVIHHQRKT